MFDKIIDGFLQFGLPGVVLAACMAYIFYKDKMHREERNELAIMHKSERFEFRSSLEMHQDQLIHVIEDSNQTQKELALAITKLEGKLT